MSEHRVLRVPESWASRAWINSKTYQEMYDESIRDPENFWAKQSERIDWIHQWTRVKNTSFTGDIRIRWYEGGKLNLSSNCIDRHLPKRANQTAIIWEPDDPSKPAKRITYQELHKAVCQYANILKAEA